MSDSMIYSPHTEMRGDHLVQLTWWDFSNKQGKEIERLRKFEKMISDLDRNENGRHEGDADYGDPSGISQGNPGLKTGDVLGYDICGRKYVMPERGMRHDPDSWRG